MQEEVRVTVIATGFDKAVAQQLRTPTEAPLRLQRAVGDGTVPAPREPSRRAPGSAPPLPGTRTVRPEGPAPEDSLEVPAFLRRQSP